MSTGTDAAQPEPEGLQFDHAEFEQAPPSTVSCAACKRPIADHYFEINGTVVCEPCKGVINTSLRGGSALVRFTRALVFGLGTAIIGTIGCTLISRATKGEIGMGLLLIVMGYLIGRAVRSGSRNLGGLGFQLLAITITYLAIGATYTAVILTSDDKPRNPPLAKAPVDPAGQPPAQGPGKPAPPPLSGPEMVSMAILAIFLSIQMPILLAQQNVITIVIIGFALWQAWRINRRLKLVVTGPYRVGESGPEGSIQGSPAHA
jgi:hypothetical protein